MRLPKFRCKNKVGNWCFFTVLYNGNVNEENFNLETLSEFTGLLDKQGVEIYECDIVVSKSYPFYGDAPEITNSGGKCEELNYVGVVVWCEETLAYYLDYKVVSNRVRGHACGNMLSEYKNLNVIGNIYENPELLHAKE